MRIDALPIKSLVVRIQLMSVINHQQDFLKQMVKNKIYNEHNYEWKSFI